MLGVNLGSCPVDDVGGLRHQPISLKRVGVAAPVVHQARDHDAQDGDGDADVRGVGALGHPVDGEFIKRRPVPKGGASIHQPQPRSSSNVLASWLRASVGVRVVARIPMCSHPVGGARRSAR